MLTRDACRTTSESFGVRRIACIVLVWATTQRTLLTCGAPLPNEAVMRAAKKRGQPGQSWYRRAAKLGRAALKANARRFAANMRPIIDEIMSGRWGTHARSDTEINEGDMLEDPLFLDICSFIPTKSARFAFLSPRPIQLPPD